MVYDFTDRGLGRYPPAVGTAGTGTTATEYGNTGQRRTTVLAMAGTMPAITAGAHAYGLLIYTFPAGVHRATRVTMSVGVDGADATNNADTPEVGVGSVIATGSVLVLNGTTGFDDYVTEKTATNLTGTPTVFAFDTADASFGLRMNLATGVKAVYLNMADTWAGTDSGPVLLGTVTLEWTYEGP